MSNWISVEDRLPPNMQQVLYFSVNNMGKKEIATGCMMNGEWTHSCFQFYAYPIKEEAGVKVTHWMELPEYPIIKADDLP